MKNSGKLFSDVGMPLFWMLLFLISLGLIPMAEAQVSGVTVAVDGMSCPFCAFGVEKRLKKVKGVDSVAVDLKSGSATLTVLKGKTIHVDQVPAAVKAAGFTPGEIQVIAVGTIKLDDQNRHLFQTYGSDQTFLLTDVKNKPQKGLNALSQTGALVKISGIFHQHKDEMPAITPEGIEEVLK